MHPQLSEKKTIVCRDFIEALDKCHESSWARLTGGCNAQKDALNQCLRKERLVRSTKNRENSKERRAKMETAWKEFHEDD